MGIRVSGVKWGRVAAATACAACLLGSTMAACDNSDYYGEESYGGGYSSTGPTGSAVIEGDGGPSSSLVLAKIDPSASMVQTPGQGVGVFTQYDPGGHWYVWWTCDTNTSGQACNFDVKVSVAQGEITGATPQNFLETDLLSGGGASAGDDAGVDGAEGSDAGGDSGVKAASGSRSVTAQATTTTMVQGIHFDTAPGAIITLSAALGGEYSGSFLFFVQDDKVNGGYTGTLSDPLELQSSSP